MRKTVAALIGLSLLILTTGADCIVSDCSVFCFP